MFMGTGTRHYSRVDLTHRHRYRAGVRIFRLSKGPVISIVEDFAAVRAATENLVKSLGFDDTPSRPRRSFSSRNAWRKPHV